MSRNDLSLTSKIALLDKIKSQPLDTSYRRLAEITGVPSTISRVLRQESQLREEFVLQGQAGTSKRKREGKDPDVEEALDQWFSIVSGRGVNINGPILKAKSEEFAKKLDRNDFKQLTVGYRDGKQGTILNLKKRAVKRPVPTTKARNSGKLQKFLPF
ncbi:Tigger transposable element-derived protein 4 [Bulinus truncatus]|nr:Tigger transposable element-derived protein 4 [Bulinus truncatus]